MVKYILEMFVFLVTSIISILSNIFIYKFIDKLEKDNCKCSEMKIRGLIKNMAPIMISLTVILFLFKPVLNKEFLVKQGIFIFTLILGLIGLFYSILILVYFSKLIYRNCGCSDKMERYSLLYPVFNFIIGFTIGICFVLLDKLIN